MLLVDEMQIHLSDPPVRDSLFYGTLMTVSRDVRNDIVTIFEWDRFREDHFLELDSSSGDWEVPTPPPTNPPQDSAAAIPSAVAEGDSAMAQTQVPGVPSGDTYEFL